MPITLEIFSATDTLANHQAALRRQEKHGFVLLSFTTGRAEGKSANLVTFLQDGTAPAGNPISLQNVSGALDKDEQEAALNGMDGTPVCYGTLFVGSKLTNVVALR